MKKVKPIYIVSVFILILAIFLATNKNTFSLNLETEFESDEYIESELEEFPTKRYNLNTELSECNNDSDISYDKKNNVILITGDSEDKCKTFFNVSPADVFISASDIPSTYGSNVILNCSDNNASYNSKYNRFEISSIGSKNSKCTVEYSSQTGKQLLSDYVISLVSTTASQDDWKVLNEPTTDYRYEGLSPNNFVWFNNELWRIIGVFKDNTHGMTDDEGNSLNLVKIIRNEPIGSYPLNVNGKADWSTSSLKKLLDDGYYNAKDVTDSDYCYAYGSYSPTNYIKTTCDFRLTGIQSAAREMIKKVLWKIGIYSHNYSLKDGQNTASQFYTAERRNNSSDKTSVSEGYIALMYASDYAYGHMAVGYCKRTSNLQANSSCNGKTFLYNGSNEWLLTPDSFSSQFYIQYNYYISTNTNYVGLQIRPTLYLNESVFLISGSGTATNPYIIGM